MKTRLKYKKRRKRSKNKTRKIKGGGRNYEQGDYSTWRDVDISSPDDHLIIYRIAALAHAGFSWTRIRKLLDGYNPDTGEKHYTFQLVNLDTNSFNSLLSDGNMAMAIREGNDAYEEFKNGLEQYQLQGAVNEYRKWVFKENYRLKKKSEKLLKESAVESVDPDAPPPDDMFSKKKGWQVHPYEYAESSEETRMREIRAKEWDEYNHTIQHNENALQIVAENRGNYTRAESDDKVYCINCGQPFHKGCMKAMREQQRHDKCPICRQDIFTITQKQEGKWLENIDKYKPDKLILRPKRLDEEGCPICLLSWDDCDINVGRWGDDIIVETRLQRWLRTWRQRARNVRQRLRNTRCAIMGGRKRKTRKKKRKKRKTRKKGTVIKSKANAYIIKGRRIMDHPSHYDLEVKKSKIHGYGLFAKKDIKKNHKIVPYNHLPSQVMKWRDFTKKYGRDYRFSYSLQRVGKIINQKNYQNLISFINDNRPRHNAYLKKRALYAKRNIKAGEEITLSYPHYNPRNR